MKNKLKEHLSSIGICAKNMINHMLNKLIKSDSSITEKLKTENLLLSVKKINNYKASKEEIVYGDKRLKRYNG